MISQIKPKIRVRIIIKSLVILIISLWLATSLYSLSNKPSDLLFDYKTELFKKEEILTKEANNKANSDPSALMSIYKRLSQISLCQTNLSMAKNYINALINFTNHQDNAPEQADTYLFAANIYRDFKNFAEATIKYKQALLLIDSTANKSNLKDGNLKITKAKILNNVGVTYLLQGESESKKSQRLKDYSLAQEYFAKAIQNADTRNDCLDRTIQINLDQCLTETNFLD
jgi:hypothetical protein